MAILDAFYSLGSKINKVTGRTDTENEQGVVSDKFPELTLDIDNEALVKLTKKWEKSWLESSVYSEWVKKSTDNEDYWKGKQFTRPEVDKTRPLVDNVIFEALETYLPQVTRRNPEPMVAVAEGEQQNDQTLAYAKQVQKKLGEIADELRLRLKLKKAARHWAIYLLGAAKAGWDLGSDIPTIKIVRLKKLILDPDAIVDEDGYTGKFIGEYRKLQASIMLKMLDGIGAEKNATKIINDLVGDDLDTEVGFKEFWTDEYMCWILGDDVLLKIKNPHWNYDQQQPLPPDPNMPTAPMQEGQQPPAPQMQTIPGFNHLTGPKMPYVLLSVFNLGTQPIDDTSLIGQSLANQDVINKRNKQIDKNADSMNGGMVVSLERSGLTIQEAKGVTDALRKGGTIAIPSGAVGDAIQRMSANPLPSDVYNQLVDMRSRTRDIFGTSGITASQLQKDKTVGGKVLTQQVDTDRIGGGFSEYLEQFADDVYNYWIQLLYVYDTQYAQIQQKPKITVSVKEGSLLPKDSTTLANQAIELAGENKMSLLDLYKQLDYPNPEELAANTWLEVNAPQILYGNDPRVAQVVQAQQQAAAQAQGKPISESINFKDLPPDGKVQLAAQAGIHLHPEAVAAHEELTATRGKGSNPPASQPQGAPATPTVAQQ